MHKYVLIDKKRITESTILLTLKSDGGNERSMTFQPGQYASISFYNKKRPSAMRCFSMANSPTEQGLLQFSMRTEGRYTNALKSLKVGNRVDARGPYGNFIYNPSQDKSVVFIAGGIGITPFMSMIKYATHLKSDGSITLIYSCRSSQDAPFAQELLELERKNQNFKVQFCFSSGEVPAGLAGKATLGRITSETLDRVNPRGLKPSKYFICGPKAFMGSMAELLHSKSVKPNMIITEAFSQSALKQSDIIKSWPFNVYVLSAACLVAVGLTIMAHDLIKTLPTLVKNTNSTVNPATNSANNRQTQVGQTINTLQNQSNTVNNNSSASSSSGSTQPSTTPTTQTTTPTTCTSRC